ncbi:MAG TPA: protealysin inhibitor emfourin [Anaerolineales bacterium]|nr:protealysin inhibitor emfourin [Anaerolineales bacterium]
MINYRRTGGSGLSQMNLDLDLNSLSASAAQRLERLLDESHFFDIPFVHDLHAEPDEHEYTVTVVAGNDMHTVYATDSSMPRSLRPLIEELTDLARATG